jgi:hypothetical protein
VTVAALPGNIRFRAFQMGKQNSFGTAVDATRRLPWRYTPTVDPHWTNPDVDTGTLDPAIQPYPMAIDITGQAVGPLAANDASALWAGTLKGGVTPTSSGGADTWQFSPSATSADVFELFSAEWGDEVTGDQFQYYDGVVDGLKLDFPQDLGPIAITADLRFGKVNYPHTRQSLNVDTSPTWLYAADTTLYIDSYAGALGTTPLTDTMHDASIQIQNNIDVKRFANGSNVNFAVSGYGRGARTMETTFTFAKSTLGLQEAADWLNANPIERFVSLDTTTRKLIAGSTYYSQRIRFAGYWFTRSEQAVNSNSVMQLVCHHIYDPALVAPIDVRVVNTMGTIL